MKSRYCPWALALLLCAVPSVVFARRRIPAGKNKPALNREELVKIAAVDAAKVILLELNDVTKHPPTKAQLRNYGKKVTRLLLKGVNLEELINRLYKYCQKKNKRPTQAPNIKTEESASKDSSEEGGTVGAKVEDTNESTETDTNGEAAPGSNNKSEPSFMCELKLGKEVCYNYTYNPNKPIKINEL